MKRLLLIGIFLLAAWTATAQDALLERLRAANTFETLQLSFVQTRHSQYLTEDLVSEGTMALLAPDHLRWEVLKPYHSVFVTQGEIPVQGRRFRIPTEKDFSATALEGEDVTVKLVPLRRDLKQFFREIIVHADRKSLRITSALLVTPDGDWTRLEFRNVRTGQPIDPKLFEKQ